MSKLPHFVQYLIILALSVLGFSSLDALLGVERVWTIQELMITSFVMLWCEKMDKSV